MAENIHDPPLKVESEWMSILVTFFFICSIEYNIHTEDMRMIETNISPPFWEIAKAEVVSLLN